MFIALTENQAVVLVLSFVFLLIVAYIVGLYAGWHRRHLIPARSETDSYVTFSAVTLLGEKRVGLFIPALYPYGPAYYLTTEQALLVYRDLTNALCDCDALIRLPPLPGEDGLAPGAQRAPGEQSTPSVCRSLDEHTLAAGAQGITTTLDGVLLRNEYAENDRRGKSC